MLRRGPGEPDEAARRLNETWLSQTALFVVEYALARQWMEWGIRPDAMIGYSLGEYVAACLAGGVALSCVANGRRLREGPFARIWIQPAAGVSDRETDVDAGLRGGMRPGIGLVQLPQRGLNQESSSARHRVPRVHRQGEHDLLQLTGVGRDSREIGMQLGEEHDVLSHQSPDHHLHATDHPVEIQNLGLEQLPATEGQQLPSERRRAVGRFLDFQYVGAPGVTAREIGQQKLGLGPDDGEHVVEIVGHSAGQLPEAFQLLHLVHLGECGFTLAGALLDAGFEVVAVAE